MLMEYCALSDWCNSTSHSGYAVKTVLLVNRQTRIEFAFALGAIALGIYMFLGSTTINLGSAYDQIGPRFFPYLIAAGLVLTGAMMIIECLKHQAPLSSEVMDPMALMTLGIALVSCVLLLERLGFIVSVTVLFTLVARAFNSRRWLRDGLVGLVLAVIVFFVFTRGLGLSLPTGLPGRLF